MESQKFGYFSKSMITDAPVDPSCEITKQYDKSIKNFPGQAKYIYSFVENRMVFAKGWLDILGYHDDEITMMKIVEATAPEYIDFSNELSDKVLSFIMSKKENLEAYSYTLQVKKIHKNGHEVPLFSRIGTHKAVNGRIHEIVGVSEKLETLKFGKVMQYGTFGPDQDGFEEALDKDLFSAHAISRKEKDALSLASKGYTFKEIADMSNVSQSAIEKRIIPLYKRFGVKSLPHLISFAYENHIL